jgi:ATP-dependent Clp protease ATP-binding subunit ClpA
MDEQEYLNDPITPRWLRDIFRFLPVKSQFVLSGNVRDKYPFPIGTAYAPYGLIQYVSEALQLRGFENTLVFDPVDGFYMPYAAEDVYANMQKDFGLKFNADTGLAPVSSMDAGMDVLVNVLSSRAAFFAVFADFASRYAVRIESLTEEEHRFFTRALKLSHDLDPHVGSGGGEAQYNPLFWICDKENDLPGWLTLENPRIRTATIPKPDSVVRKAFIGGLAKSLPGFNDVEEDAQVRHRATFVEQTEGMFLTDVVAVTQLCRRENLKFEEIGEAVRRYKLGVTEDPWKKLDLDKISNGREFIEKRLKGQGQAVTKSLDIIKRAVTGITGASGSSSGRPKGMLFLAGPTGTGKTELAKTLTELLFGDPRAYIRFDMSEFSAEHADQRLMGAPPGYVGYEAGGELTNSVKQKPFSVILFDEIEKAHPRILDKFLQILDDGQLTDGRGDRVYFSEAIIIFTSNLGIFKTNPQGQREENVNSAMPFETVQSKIREEIGNYFKFTLNRPEILNRFGENIVVFDFIRKEVAVEIYGKVRDNLLQGIKDGRKIEIGLSGQSEEFLLDKCTQDLSNGGRGIVNQLEAWLVNPLAREFFDKRVADGARVTVERIWDAEGVPSMEITPA